MPTPEREVRPQSQAVSAVSMKDLLASCAAAAAVSTPPRVERAGEAEEKDDKKDGRRLGRRTRVQPPARRDAA